MTKTPEVLTGARGTADERAAIAAEKAAKRSPGVVEVPENEIWFQGKYTKLRVQLTAPEDVRLPDGRVKRGKPLVAQFDGGFLRIKKNKKNEELIQLLSEHESYGINFWNFQDVVEKQRKAETDKVVQILQDPKQRELILASLKAEGVDFVLPTRSSGGQKGAKAEAADAPDSK